MSWETTADMRDEAAGPEKALRTQGGSAVTSASTSHVGRPRIVGLSNNFHGCERTTETCAHFTCAGEAFRSWWGGAPARRLCPTDPVCGRVSIFHAVARGCSHCGRGGRIGRDPLLAEQSAQPMQKRHHAMKRRCKGRPVTTRIEMQDVLFGVFKHG